MEKLKEGQSDVVSSVSVVSEFIKEILNINDPGILKKQKNEVIKYLLDILIENRSFAEVIQLLKKDLIRVFSNDLVGNENAIGVLRLWVKDRDLDLDI